MFELIQETSDERVAILLRALEGELSQQILSALPDRRAGEIRKAMGELNEDDLEPEVVDDVLVDFERFLRFAMTQEASETPSLRIAGTAEDNTDSDDDTAEDSAETRKTRPFEPSGDPVADLNRLRPFQIAKSLEREHPRTTALVMNQLQSDTAAQVLPLLPDEVRSDVFLQMNRSDTSPALLVERIVRTTVINALEFEEPEGEELDADERAAALLRSLEKSARKEMLAALEQDDAEMADRVRGLLYEFEDIRRLAPRSVQKLLGEFDLDTLSAALQGADTEIVEQVKTNLSRRARDRLIEEMELASADGDAMAAARKQVAEAMGRLDQAGELKMVS